MTVNPDGRVHSSVADFSGLQRELSQPLPETKHLMAVSEFHVLPLVRVHEADIYMNFVRASESPEVYENEIYGVFYEADE